MYKSELTGGSAAMENADKFSQLRKTLEATTIFCDENFDTLTSYLKVKVLKKKDFFNLQDQFCRYVAYVNSGCLRAFHTNDRGDEFTLFFAFAGLWAGDKTSFYSGKPSVYSIQALEDSEIVYVDRENWEAAMDAAPAFEKWYRARSRTMLEEAQRKLVSWQTESAEEKYLKLLNEAPAIIQRIPQHYIASYFSIRPQSLSRIRKNIISQL